MASSAFLHAAAAVPPPGARAAGLSMRAAHGRPSPAARARIIIADDDEIVVDAVRRCLEARGHIVGALPDGSRVREVVEFKQPDLVIVDCVMPGASGIEVLRQIRTSATAYHVPVLMLTGRQSDADEAIALRAGADDYLRKPFDADQLAARVEVLLAQG